MLKEKIHNDLLEAMKARDSLKMDALRLLKNAIMKLEVAGEKRIVDDKEILSLIKKEVKQRDDAAEQFRKGGRDAMAEKEEKEKLILLEYLPEQMSEEEVMKILTKIKEDEGISGKQDFGKFMSSAMAQIGDRADGKTVSSLVSKLI